MKIHIEEFVSQVLARMAETPSPSSAFAGEPEGLSLRALVRLLSAESVSEAILSTPHHLLDDFSVFGDGLEWLEGGRGYVPLPKDFLRLGVFRMSDWSRGVTDPVAQDSPQARLQYSPWLPLQGKPHRPVCVIRIRGGARVLEFHSCRDQEAIVKEAFYIPRPELTAAGYFRIPEAALAAAESLCAEKTIRQLSGGITP